MSTPAARAATPVQAVVFDLGGVLLRLADPLELFELEQSESGFLALWLRSHSVREFERGGLDAQAFAEGLVRELGLPMTARQFLERFRAWPQALFPGTRALLESIPPGIRRVLLSNTNALHWDERPDVSGALAGLFDRTFLSYRTGLLKPDREAFAQVVTSLACAPGEILFFDDNPGNVEAALRLGWNAHRARGPADVRRVLDKTL